MVRLVHVLLHCYILCCIATKAKLQRAHHTRYALSEIEVFFVCLVTANDACLLDGLQVYSFFSLHLDSESSLLESVCIQ